MADETVSRRTFLARVGAWSALAASSGLVVQSCRGKGDGARRSDGDVQASTCDDPAALTDTDKLQRKALAYVDVSTVDGKTCSGCQQFVAPEGDDEDACGTCKVVPGSISPKGHCNVWVQKTT